MSKAVLAYGKICLLKEMAIAQLAIFSHFFRLQPAAHGICIISGHGIDLLTSGHKPAVFAEPVESAAGSGEQYRQRQYRGL
jgi:hypothetical protein